ncbi:MAG: translation initiation factor IF-2 N-terminal domain-containing protein, partial [Flavisolibacter sp.]|nr:translation initiation factor IF-2 N-terminal domain-containing protein [Flavisolibacter sp.]
MAETITTPRLMAAAKEFNIGKDTLVDFLVTKGFDKDELKPTAKLSEEMYRALQEEFKSDKVAKLKAISIDLPKGASGEPKKKKDEEEINFRKEKEEKKTPKKEEPAPAPVVEEVQAPAPEPDPEPVVEPIPEPEPVQEKETPPPAEPEVPKVEAPGMEGPKVLAKIDLSTIDSSTRPKKTAKKVKKEDSPARAAELKQPQETPVAQAEVQPPVKAEEEAEPVIENIKADKLEGPKIMGKIELPVDSDTRPKPEEKRKRKRIPIEKKEMRPGITQTGQGGRFGQTGNVGRTGAPPRQGGGGRFTPQRAGTANTGGGRREDKQIDEKEIQRKIQETQAKLSGSGGKGKNIKAKLRRERRSEMADSMDGNEDNKLQVTEFISVSELANLMDVSFAEVISKCMGLGIMVSINQRLDAEVIELVSSEFGFDVEFIDMEKQLEMEEEDDVDNEEDLVSRSPIVTIMGHVDHGKTSLLDYIRNAAVVAGEAGGITQHIGAYQVHLPNDKDITFLDTPGHEAFTAMRARGAKVTDIAVIVIAADDAIMPQTREAISHAQAAGVPMIFAVNKIDKDGANPAKIYEQLAGMNLLVESWGGKHQSQEISAKQGLNIELLLEKILLEAELLDLKANPKREANGTIIEATLDKGRG